MLLFAWLLSCAVVMTTTVGARRHGRGGGGGGRGGTDVIDNEDCMFVQGQCMSRTGCNMALTNYMIMCRPIVDGTVPEGHCTLQCRNALVTLLSMDDHQGEVFMTCRCNGNALCEEQKQRLEVCHEEVIHAVPAVMDNLTDISCNLAMMICNADTSCQTALNYYHHHCQKLIRGEKCSGKCNNSLSILYSQRKARKLRTCLCDGTEMYNCEELRYNTETLCHRRHGRPASGNTGHGHHHHQHESRPRTPAPPTDTTRGWGEVGGWGDREEDYENERDEEEEEKAEEKREEEEEEKNYTGRRKKNLTYVASSSGSSMHRTVLWVRQGWVLVYLTLLLRPLLKYTSLLL